MNQGSRPYALSIAGFDPSAGAGVLADIKTFETNGVYGLGVVSALTWQNDVEFEKIEWMDCYKIIQQVSILLLRFDIKYIKIGLVESMNVLHQLIGFLKARIKYPVIIFDPVMKASAGFVFHQSVRKICYAQCTIFIALHLICQKLHNCLAGKTCTTN